ERAPGPSQPGLDVVVDDDDAERRVSDDHGRQAESDAERVEHGAERGVERDAGDDAGQRYRQDHQETHGVLAEEVVTLYCERGHGAEHDRYRGGPEPRLDARP